jgi:hypothetical protein
MADLTIRLHYRDKAGKVEDAQNDLGLESFGGQLPMVGDLILDPGVTSGLDRRERKNRRMWTVMQRVFNPRDNADYIALVVEERQPTESEEPFL